MTQLKPILMAILAVFGWLFALPTSAARRGGFNFLCALMECGNEDAGKGSPYQQVCPAGAACNQGVQ